MPATTSEYLNDLGEALGNAEVPGYTLSWEYPGFLCIYPDALPGIHFMATPGWEADDEALDRGEVEVPVQWSTDPERGDDKSLEADPIRLSVTNDLTTDIAAYVALLPRIVAAIAAERGA